MMKKLFVAVIGLAACFGVSQAQEIRTGYKGFADVAYSINAGNVDGASRIEVSTTHGYQIIPHLFVGAGVAYNYFHEVQSSALPVFADVRGTLPIGKFSPFVDARIGYSVLGYTGLYFNPSIGCRLGVTDSFGFNLSVGYSMQDVEVDYYRGGSGKESAGAVTIRLGIDF